VYISAQHGIIEFQSEEIKMEIIEYHIETNENATQNLVDNNGNLILDAATTDEINDYLTLLQKENVEHLESLKS